MNDQEIREEIVRQRVEERIPANILADKYGVPISQVYRWTKEYRRKAAEDQKRTELRRYSEDNERLRSENAALREEIEFLKKTAAYFAAQAGQQPREHE